MTHSDPGQRVGPVFWTDSLACHWLGRGRFAGASGDGKRPRTPSCRRFFVGFPDSLPQLVDIPEPPRPERRLGSGHQVRPHGELCTLLLSRLVDGEQGFFGEVPPSSFSGNNGTCLGVAALPDEHIAVRNSKHPDDGTILFTPAEINAEINAWISGTKSTGFDWVPPRDVLGFRSAASSGGVDARRRGGDQRGRLGAGMFR